MDFPVLHALLSFALIAALITIVPGPDTALVLRTALLVGRRQAFATALGIGTGTLVWGVAAATGVSVLLTVDHVAYVALRIVGALYLVWLGIGMLRDARRPGETGHAAEPPRRGAASAYLRGVGTNLLNPKVGALYVALIPQFIPAHSSHLAMGLALAAVHDLEGLVWFSIFILAAHRARTWFSKDRVRRGFDALTGTVLVGFGVELATRS
jgi:threonine/homoserine/homoserine lactone efflux protein